jgi:hypothetical protein
VRRGLGRGRTLIALGAILVIVSMPFAWLRVGGVVLSAETANGFQGSGVLTFVACLVMLALIVLPYASRSRRSTLDRALAYLLCWMAAVTGSVGQAWRILSTEASSISPGDAPGLWLAAGGMALITWGLLELFAERDRVP